MAKFNENGEENGSNCFSSKKTQKTSKQKNKKEEDLVVDNCNVQKCQKNKKMCIYWSGG